MSHTASIIKFDDNVYKSLFLYLSILVIYFFIIAVTNRFDLPIEILFEYTDPFFIPRSMIAVQFLVLFGITILFGIGGGYLNLPLLLICGFLTALWTGLFAGILLPTMTTTDLLLPAFTGGLWIALPSGIVYGLPIGVVGALIGHHSSGDNH